MDTWMRLRLVRPESRFTKQMSRPYSIPLRASSSPLSSRRHSSLWTFFFVALVRSTVLMALLAHRPAEEPTRTEETNGQTETERQRLSEREESVVYKKKKPRRYFTDANAVTYGGDVGGSRGWKETEGTTREGVVGCGQIC